MGLVAALALAAPGAARTDDYKLETGIDRTAQLTELLGLYQDLCLTAFPDDGAVFRRVVALKNTTPLTGDALNDLFHGDPGLAWTYRGKSSHFLIAVETPPFHSCTVRTTMAGFGENKGYRAIAERYEKKATGFHAIDLLDRVDGGIRTVLAGEQREKSDGSTDALMILVTTPADQAVRQAGYSGVDVRLVHQLAQPPEPPRKH